MSENSNQNSVVSVRVVEIIVALMFLVVGLVVMTGSIKLGAKWGSDGPESGYFPFYISLIILVSSSITLFQAFKNKEQAEEELMKLFDVTEKDFSCYMPIDMVKQLMQSGKGSSSAREILRCILQAK